MERSKSKQRQSREFRPSVLATCLVIVLLGCQQAGNEVVQETRSDAPVAEAQKEVVPANKPVVQQTPKRQVQADSFIRLSPVSILDRSGFGRTIPATSLLVPLGWQTHGGVVWKVNTRGCGLNNPHFSWSATSPDGRTQVQILPEVTWGGNNLGRSPGNGCPNIWLRSAEEYLRSFVSHNRPQAHIRSYQARPDIASEFKQLEQVTPFPTGEHRTWVDSGQVMVDYSDQGQAMEELIAVLVIFRLNRMQGAIPGQIQEYLTISTLPGFAMRAPRGTLNVTLAETIRSSGKANPEWAQLMAQHNAEIGRINREGAAARHRIRMDTIREIGEINRKSYEYRQRVQDKGHKKFTQTIRDVETFHSSSGAEVELPSTHKNAWKLNDGTYVLTDDMSFKPFRDLGIDGQQLSRERPN